MDKNERLLRYAGFTKPEPIEGMPDLVPFWQYPVLEPQSHIDYTDDPPDLYNSLDLQSKWLWPKLWDYVLTKWPDPHAIVVGKSGKVHTFYHDNPANACAEAILALIKEE